VSAGARLRGAAARACVGAMTLLTAACADLTLVEVHSPEGALRLRVDADLAQTAEARQQGLASWATLDEGRGLLLLFPTEGEVCVENTHVGFAIDALFADAGGQIVGIERGIPAGDSSVRCHAPVSQVLELAAGVALSVHPSDVLEQRP